jgi:hypothetical protein
MPGGDHDPELLARNCVCAGDFPAARTGDCSLLESRFHARRQDERRQLRAARMLAAVATVQNRYNLAYRAAEDVFDFCGREQIGFIPLVPGCNRQARTSRWAARRGRS